MDRTNYVKQVDGVGNEYQPLLVTNKLKGSVLPRIKKLPEIHKLCVSAEVD